MFLLICLKLYSAFLHLITPWTMGCQINAFTDRAFGGNPAAVCYLPYEKDDKWLQLIAREFNLSETAFLVKRRNTRKDIKREQGAGLLEVDESGTELKAVKKNVTPVENEFDLRWFTPTVEVL